jgi:anti-sigma factor RsiW
MNGDAQPRDDALSAMIREHATRHGASEALRASVRTEVALAAAGRFPPPLDARPTWFARVRQAVTHSAWRVAAVGFALGTVFTVFLAPSLQRIDWGQPLQAELVADHVRAMGAGPLLDVASSDRHTVKPWYQGRLDYSPPVLDLAADGFPLSGGRIERVRGSAVAALVYSRDRHLIDLYVWPENGTTDLKSVTHRGFNVVSWSESGMQLWAVSDVERPELERFARLWQARAVTR